MRVVGEDEVGAGAGAGAGLDDGAAVDVCLSEMADDRAAGAGKGTPAVASGRRVVSSDRDIVVLLLIGVS